MRTVGVLGAGLMGAGIADVSLNKAKLNVLMKGLLVYFPFFFACFECF